MTNLRIILWEMNQEFPLTQSQEFCLNKSLGQKGFLYLYGETGTGKTFLGRRITQKSGLYLPIHYNFSKYLSGRHERIIVDNVYNFTTNIIQKIKRLIPFSVQVLVIGSTEFSELPRIAQSLFRKYYQIKMPTQEELHTVLADIVRILPAFSKENPPTNFKSLHDVIGWLEHE